MTQKQDRITFFIREQDNALTQSCISFLQALILPEGMEGNIVVGEEEETEADYRVYLSSTTFVVCREMVMRALSLFETHPGIDALGVMGRAADGAAPLISGVASCDTGRLLLGNYQKCREFAGKNTGDGDGLQRVQALSDVLIITKEKTREDVAKGDATAAVALQEDGVWACYLDTSKKQAEILTAAKEILKEEYGYGLQMFAPHTADVGGLSELYDSLMTLSLMIDFDTEEGIAGVLAQMIAEDMISDVCAAVIIFRHAYRPFDVTEKLIACADAQDAEIRKKFSRLCARWRDMEIVGRELQQKIADESLVFSDLTRYDYAVLGYLFRTDRDADPGNKTYNALFDKVCACQEAHVSMLEKVHVVFFAISASEWMMERVYHLLEESERFTPHVVVMPAYEGDPDTQRRIYDKTLSFFRENGYRTIGVLNDHGQVLSFAGLGIPIDIAVHMTQSYPELPDEMHLLRLPLTVLNVYAPYGLCVMGGRQASTVNYDYYNLHLQWKILADAPVNAGAYTEVGHIPAAHIVTTGYPKMDYFYESHDTDPDTIWKTVHGNAKEVTKVIWSPHHSMSVGLFSTATIQYNLWYMLELAEKYREETSWIVKPHPALPNRAILAGLFKDLSEYDAYTARWEALPNARWAEEISYPPVFATSDGILNDSCSFIAEYMYTGKPMLFLENGTDPFGTLGRLVHEGLYHADGRDFAAIEAFLTDVLMRGNDTMKEKRREIFASYLDYCGFNGKSASQMIFDTLSGLR